MQIQIAQYVFNISDHYTPGAPLGEIEATLLNRMRGVNLVDSLTGRVREAIASAGPRLLSDSELLGLQWEITKADEAYALRLPLARPKYGTIDYVARRIALADAQRDALARGHLLDEGEAAGEVERRLRDPGLQARAKAEFEVETRAAKAGLESLV